MPVQFEGDVFARDIDYRDVNIAGPSAAVNAGVGPTKCCFAWPVFASLISSDPLKNDYRRFIRFASDVYSITWTLETEVSCGVWAEVAVIVDDTYGELYNDLRTRDNVKPWGLLLDFKKVLAVEGPGLYRVKIDYTEAVFYTDAYRLCHYHPALVDLTTLLEYEKNSVVSSRFDPQVLDDYTGLNWVDRLRLPDSSLHPLTIPFEKQTSKQASGFENPIAKKYRNRHQLILEAADPIAVNELKFALMDSNYIKATDYSLTPLKGLAEYRERFVDIDGDFNPGFARNMQKGSTVIELVDSYNTTEKRFS